MCQMINLYYLRLIDFVKKNIPHNGVHSLSHKLIGEILYKCKNNWQNELVHVELNKARLTKAWFITADYHGLFQFCSSKLCYFKL